MGGGSQQPAPPPPPPAPPSVGETSAQAIQAQIDALPKILASQQQYGPQFSELNLEQLKQFGPQFAEEALALQKKYAPQFADVERSLSPELVEAQKTLTGFLQGTDDPTAFKQDIFNTSADIRGLQGDTTNQGMDVINRFLQGTDEQAFNELRPGLLEDVRAGQSLRGLGSISPLGSIDEAVQVARLKEDLRSRRLGIAQGAAGLELQRQGQNNSFLLNSLQQASGLSSLQQALADRRTNVALSTAGRVPISQFPQIQGNTGSGQLISNVSPDSIFSYQDSLNRFNSDVFGSSANIFGSQAHAATQRRAQNIGLFSDIAGGAMSLGSAFI